MVLTSWGIITLISLCVTLGLSIYKQYIDEKEAEKVSEENEYLKLSELTIGPYYTLRFIFNDSIFSDDIPSNAIESLAKKKAEAEKIQRAGYDSITKESLLNSINLEYDNFYIDNTSKRLLFENEKYVKGQRHLIGKFEFFIGTLIYGTIEFRKDGTVFPNLIYDKTISALLGDSLNNGYFELAPKNLTYYKNEMIITGTIPIQVRAGTIYQAVLNDYRKKTVTSSFKLYFDSLPQKENIDIANKSLNSIKEVRLEMSYDPEATRWLIVPFALDKNPKVHQDKYYNTTFFSSIQMAQVRQLPYVGDISQ